MYTTQTCGHPTQCLETDASGEDFCRWCGDLEEFRDQQRGVIDEAKKQAFVVKSAGVLITPPGVPIGHVWLEGDGRLHTAAG